MKTTTKLLTGISALLILVAAPAVFSGEKMSGERFDRMVSSLGLTAEQAEKLQPMMEKHRADRKAKMETLREEHRANLLTILSEEQVAKMESKRKSHHKKSRKHGKKHGQDKEQCE